MNKKILLTSFFALIFVLGASWIVYNGRPVMKMVNTVQSSINNVSDTAQTEAETVQASGTPTNQSYTLVDIQQHSTSQSCWTTINGSVYDLTSWVSRHPGGAQDILEICGIDATTAFQRQHGRSKRAQSTLVLFKIGELSA